MEIRIGTYCRVSTMEQTKGVSIEAQLERLRNYAKFKEWTTAREFIDPGWSGKDDNRPGLKGLMAAARRGDVDVVIVTKIDRLMRNTRLLLQYVDEFKKLGVRFIATDDNIDTGEGKTGQLMLTILAGVAQWERERIGERVSEGKQYRLNQGRWPSGRTPYGYRWLPKQQEWLVDEAEAKVVQHVYDLYLRENLGTMKIPFRLNEECYRTRSGSRWSFTSVYNMLINPAYKGEHERGLKMPVMIDGATWELAQQKRLKARKVRGAARHWLLQGMCFCGECGRVLTCQQKDSTERRYYSCQGRYIDSHLDGSPRCDLPRMEADLLEKKVWQRFKAVVSNSEVLKQGIRDALADISERKDELGKETAAVDKELEGIRAKKERLGLAFADGALTKEVYTSRLRKLTGRESELVKMSDNLDPETHAEIDDLERAVTSIKKMLDKYSGRIVVTDFGIWGIGKDEIMPLGYNAWLETDGTDDIGMPREPTKFRIEGTDKVIKGIDAPEGFWDSTNRLEVITKNRRGMLQKFGVRVYVFKEKMEIRGLISAQVLALPKGDSCSQVEEPVAYRTDRRGPIIDSARGTGG